MNRHELEKNYTQEQLISAGGKLWVHPASNTGRVYFNNLADLIGLEVRYYNTGNVAHATLNGEKISNSHAAKILSDLDFGKIWYDLDTHRFVAQHFDSEWFDAVVAAIEKRTKGGELK